MEGWLRNEHGLESPRVNQSRADQGILLARLSLNEYLFLEKIDDESETYTSFVENAQRTPISASQAQIFYLPRQDSHACFLVRGVNCSLLFSKLCAINFALDIFPQGQVAQTSMARCPVIVIRNDLEDAPAFLLLVDSSFAEYLWDCLAEAGNEYNIVQSLL